MIYKLYKTLGAGQSNAVMTVGVEPCKSFIFDPANTDYVNFKTQVLAGEAQLQDADGNVMSADEAKEFVKTLP